MQPLCKFRITVLCLFLLGLVPVLGTAAMNRPVTDKSALNQLADFYSKQLRARRGARYLELLRSTEPAQKALNQDSSIQLMFVDEHGKPIYYQMGNLTAAKTVSTNKVWPGGGYGYSLTGSSTLAGELGIWDGGGVLTTHRAHGPYHTNRQSWQHQLAFYSCCRHNDRDRVGGGC